MRQNPSQKIACLSVDVEPDLGRSTEQVRLFEDESRLDALCSLLRREDVPLTCFVVMKHAKFYADSLSFLADRISVEFAVHSFSHDQRFPASVTEISWAWDSYCNLWNRKPRGYRSPHCLISTSGLRNLTSQGFLYDSSVTPSVRFDQFKYNNLHLPTDPFWFKLREQSILELPIACFSIFRIPLILSYAKLIGPRAMHIANHVLSLPDVVVVYFHPYDLYVAEIAGDIQGWKRYAHLRNARYGMRILENMISMLKRRGYKFMLMENAVAEVASRDCPVLSTLGG
jgi:hypothetical protein